jgi:hypothetical protein
MLYLAEAPFLAAITGPKIKPSFNEDEAGGAIINTFLIFILLMCHCCV